MKTLLLTGSNQGERESYMASALEMISDKGKILKSSSLYETKPWGFENPVSFLNQALLLNTSSSPLSLLRKLQQIEKQLGRRRIQSGYAARTMDIDILLYDQVVLNSLQLTIPHPRMHQRRFALTPAAEICPDWIHPLFNLTLKQLLANCTDTLEVKIFK